MELLLPGTSVLCPGLVTPEGINEADVREAYKTYYIPSNMTLVVVGSFDRGAVMSQIKATFGRLRPGASGNKTELAKPPYPNLNGTREVTGTFAPLLGSDASVGFVYRTEGSDSPDYYALWVLARYVNRVVFEKLRVDKALSYSPASGYFGLKGYGIFVAVADANFDKLELAKALLEEELENLRQGRIKAEEVRAAEQSLLVQRVFGFESNSSIAAYYTQNLQQLTPRERRASQQNGVASLAPEDLQRVANKYLRNDARVIIRSTPTLTFTQFYIGLGVFAVTIPGAGFYLVRRFLKRPRIRGGPIKEST
jgi:zinc protease